MMALQSAYKQFLAAPSSSLLASDASLHYITTLTTLHGSSEIIKHLNGQTRDLTIKEEKLLDVIEGANALAVEVHTTIDFLQGGGAYLPRLDDNFLADRTVTFPIIHIVSFDADGKITQIRKSWDQGSLLKLIDVIGKTGRNWPIQDGKDQIKLIISSVKSAGKTPVDVAANADDGSRLARSRENSTSATRDPHASLSLFAPREKQIQEALPAVVAPRASSRPPPRDYNDLFVSNDDDAPDTPVPQAHESPSKFNIISPKAGAGKNFAPSRLFETDADTSLDKLHGSEHFYRPNPAKFQHFDFADAPQEGEVKSRPLTAKSAKHGSQWKFDDFNTPQKIVPSKVLRTNEVRHWSNSDDELTESPVHTKKVDKPRKDAETHFEFQDDGMPEEGRRLVGRPRGAGQNNGLGLYKDTLFEEPNGTDEPTKHAHGLANVKDRRKDFDPHFTMTDESPGGVKMAPPKLSEDRAKVVKMMDANWAPYDQSPSQKENMPTSPSANRPNSKGPLSEATNVMSHRNDNPKGILTDGDGMGGKKGVRRQWGFGDDSDGEGVNKPGKFQTGKTHGKNPSTAGGDFWDF